MLPARMLRVVVRAARDVRLALEPDRPLSQAVSTAEEQLAQLPQPLERLVTAPRRAPAVGPLVVAWHEHERVMDQFEPFLALQEKLVAAGRVRRLEISHVHRERKPLPVEFGYDSDVA